jgi:phenylacetate-CoA ligase
LKGVYLIPDIVRQIISRHDSLGKFQIIVNRRKRRENLIIKVESSDSENNQGITQLLIEDLRAATRLRAEIDLVPFGSMGQDAPLVIDERLH